LLSVARKGFSLTRLEPVGYYCQFTTADGSP